LLMVKFVPFADLATMIQTYANYVLFSGIVALILGAFLISNSRG